MAKNHKTEINSSKTRGTIQAENTGVSPKETIQRNQRLRSRPEQEEHDEIQVKNDG